MVKKTGFLFLFLIGVTTIYSQQISVHANDEALNKVLIEIRNSYNIQLSFDDALLSKYKVTVDQSFENPENALAKLLDGLPLAFEKSGSVFIIYAIDAKKFERPAYRLSGKILETGTKESLPYSQVIINGSAQATDLRGSFSHLSKDDSIFSIQASQLGYYILDTVIGAGTNHQLLLSPSIIGLTEVIIADKRIEKSTQIGEQAGVEKLNHKVANFLPGYGDNSVYNLLRLQPGILASGESTSEPIIWGGYSGQSKIMFDGFTIYGKGY